jgi:Uma2 family endonuclease
MRMLSAERRTKRPSPREAMAMLENGSRMDQPTFHKLYMLTPDGFKAELIGGEVYVSSPVSWYHGVPHAELLAWLVMYKKATRGVEVADNSTSILGENAEPQPDAAMLIRGGQSRLNRDGCVVGAPELVAEVANSSAAIDLGKKKMDYQEAGTQEYLVALVKEKRIMWFVRREEQFVEMRPRDGVFRSRVFPGLWLPARGFFRSEMTEWIDVLHQGLASSEHAAFVAELAARNKMTKPRRKRR